MDTKFLKILFIFLLLFLSNNKIVFSEIIKDIRVIGNDRISKYDFGTKVSEIFSLNKKLIVSDNFTKRKNLVIRPLDMSLSNSKVNLILSNSTNSIEKDLNLLKQLEARHDITLNIV